MLTDFVKSYAFFWIGHGQGRSKPIVYGTKFNDIHKAATFARTLLLPDQNLPSFPEAIQNQFPVFEKRVDIAEMEVDSDDGDNSDIGNFDDYGRSERS